MDAEEKAGVMEASGGDAHKAIQIMLEQNFINEKLLDQARRQELGRRLKFLTQVSKSGEFAFFLSGEEGSVEGLPRPFFQLEETVSPQNLLTQGFIDESNVPKKIDHRSRNQNPKAWKRLRRRNLLRRRSRNWARKTLRSSTPARKARRELRARSLRRSTNRN